MEWMMRKTKTKKKPPRFERLNAKKNINYQLPTTTATATATTIQSPTPSPSDEETSLRVLGIDGEFDRIFQSLGLSGPEDFSIPTQDWEARKVRSSNLASISVSNDSGVVIVSDSPSSSGEHDVRDVVDPLRNGERSVLFTDSGSFTTSHDYDSDGGGGERTAFPYGWLKPTFSSWQKGAVLGKGSFGTVYECFTDDGYFYAVKEVSLLDDGNQGKQSIFQLQQEISLLSRFQHENIVRYYGSDKNESTLYIFLELVSKGSLASLYQSYHLNDSQVSAYTRQILNGLKYLHENDVVHRDIKCANILVDVNGSVKLADFGLAKATKLNDVKSSKGSPYWMAPEVVNLRNQGYGLAADIWSLGCTVLEMLTRKPPYFELEGMQAIFRIGRGEPPPIPESLSNDARDFILKCLQVNPSKRPTAAQLSNHPFLRRRLSAGSPRINSIVHP
ncbi:mitogen-activated protein kinase kinase kinase 1 [Lathyrus oleraceus]|uniref:mitogen-activated protein kinase kinase kinase n=1 Tax=Pisum sativum TaxID=3888 RepID=A0A9D4VMY1_PEA|nr:mitogen-activated protein kinase kinase kinase 1-like [Pisum sativum]KAI5385789.1 Mitogen-activated protein kinase kinase kinase 1 [Pisum sativum]